VTVGSCIVVSDISSEGGNVGDPSYVKVVSQHGPCWGWPTPRPNYPRPREHCLRGRYPYKPIKRRNASAL